jgi:hypothetical protein
VVEISSSIPVRFCARCGRISETGWGRLQVGNNEKWYCFDPRNKCCWDLAVTEPRGEVP